MDTKAIKIIADAVRLAYDKGYLEDDIIFELNGDDERLFKAFRELFHERFYD